MEGLIYEPSIILLIMGLLIILRLAPVDNINNKMNQEEKNYLKKKINIGVQGVQTR